MVQRVKIGATALGLSPNVRMVNAPLRQRLGLIQVAGRDVIDTRQQPINLRLTGGDKITLLSNHTIPLNASLGVWFFQKGGTRFHEGYEQVKDLCGDEKGSDKWVEWIFTKTQEMQKKLGINISLQAHYPNEIGPQNVAKWVEMMEKTGIGVDSIVPFLFGEKIFQHGSLTNPNPEVRAFARQRQLETFQLARLLGIPTVNHWFGIDGFENAFAISNTWAFDQIEGATADAMNAVPGQQATEEPKPYEPRGANTMASTQDGLMLARGIESRLTGKNKELLAQGIRMVGMTPEIGHMQMAFEVLSKAFETCLREGRLFDIHWNGQPLGNYDIDENVGLHNFETLSQIAYVLQSAGYKGVNTLDINPLRMDLADAVMIGFLNLSAAYNQVKGMPHDLINRAVGSPEKGGNAAIQLLQLAQRYPNTPEAAKAAERIAEIDPDLVDGRLI